MRRTPLYPIHKRRGAIFGEWADWEVAFKFGDPDGENLAARSSASVFDLTPRLRLRVAGADRTDFLHRLVPSDVRALAVGRAQPSMLLTSKGKMIADFALLAVRDAYLIDAEPHVAAKLPAELEKYVIADDVQITNESATFGALSVHGPNALQVIGGALGSDLAALDRDAVVERELLATGGVIRRADRFGVPGFDVWIATEKMPELFEALRAGGARPAGFLAWESLRIESGIPRFGADIDEDSLPVEVGLESAISYTKGCYVGQETIARVKYQGHVNRQLVTVALETAAPPPRFTALYAMSDDREVGRLTSACASPIGRAVIGLAIVRRESSEAGTALRARLDSGDVRCQVTRTEPGSFFPVAPPPGSDASSQGSGA